MLAGWFAVCSTSILSSFLLLVLSMCIPVCVEYQAAAIHILQNSIHCTLFEAYRNMKWCTDVDNSVNKFLTTGKIDQTILVTYHRLALHYLFVIAKRFQLMIVNSYYKLKHWIVGVVQSLFKSKLSKLQVF